MAVGTHTFTGSSLSWTPSTGNSYPVPTRRRRVVASGETAGGVMYVQSKGIEVFEYDLAFPNLSKTDLDNLVTFLRGTGGANYTVNTFTWNDLNDVNHTVRFKEPRLDSTKLAQSVYSVTLTLREESPA